MEEVCRAYAVLTRGLESWMPPMPANVTPYECGAALCALFLVSVAQCVLGRADPLSSEEWWN